MRYLTSIAILSLLGAGCGVDAGDPANAHGAAGVPLTEEELEAKLLEMLNHETTSLEVLDIDAKLTATAAKALIAHRNGADGAQGTEDDDPFDSLQEVDDVKGVGPSALAQLKAFAETWAPPDPDATVPVDELEAKVLAMLNHATTTLTILDVNAGLTVTAAKKLIEHRNGADGQHGTEDDDPFDSLDEVDAVKYVGASALGKIKAYAEKWTPELNSDDGPKDVPKVLLFVNHETTTFDVLNGDVGLTTTQSTNVIAARDGPDGVFGTEDDGPFATVDDLDAVKYIGTKSIEKIATYADGWEPVDPAKLLEMQVLDFLNHPVTTFTVLDDTVGLTSSAAKNLIAHKNGPDGEAGTEDDDLFDSLDEVDAVKYVGASALGKIKEFAATFDPTASVPDPNAVVEEAPMSCKVCPQFAGDPNEYDPGPPPGSGWAELFAAVPNFRTVAKQKGAEWLVPGPDGKTKLDIENEKLVAEEKDPIASFTLTKDKFRYHMGPLFYRGRLDGTARVLVVGQEGATDEAIVHRAFAGGTGQKVQNFLNAIGITKSYICLNTFVYSIYEQYDAYTAEIAMEGPIAEHRNEILAKVFAENDIQLVLTFGNAAYNSVKLFRNSYYAGKFPYGTRWSHMLHPGAAAMAYGFDGEVVDSGTLGAVVQSFTQSWKNIWYWRYKYQDELWLQSDDDGWGWQSSKFYYGDRDIPYRDLPYGATVQIGRGGTKSERSAGGLQVQLRSNNGTRYEAPTTAFPATVAKAASGFAKSTPEEVAWEPPKFEADARHDSGPTAEWVQYFAQTPEQSVIETESGVDVSNDFYRRPLWYRGDINGNPSILILAQDYGTDQVVAGRALTGDAGQKVNHLLQNLGVEDGYLILNAYPYPLNDTVPDYSVLDLAQSPSLAAYRAALLQKVLAEKDISLVLTFGEVAEAAFQTVAADYAGNWIKLAHPDQADAPVSWNESMGPLKPLLAGMGIEGGAFTPYSLAGFADTRVMIPRRDLPWGVPLWFGTSGDLSQQPSRSWIFWNAPKWVKKEPSGG